VATANHVMRMEFWDGEVGSLRVETKLFMPVHVAVVELDVARSSNWLSFLISRLPSASAADVTAAVCAGDL